MRLIDNHNHILLVDIGLMVDQARRKDLEEYSITEHVSQFKEPRETIRFGSVHNRGRIFRDLKEYNEEFRKIDPGSERIGVNRGLEVDYSPRYEEKVGAFVNQEEWDILLCSVHEFENGTSIENRTEHRLQPAIAHQLWRNYLALELSALESDFIPFHVLSHPVRMSRRTRNVPPELDDLLVELARLAKRRSRALELNGSDIGYSPDLVRRLAIACSKAGCSVSLGSDAHHPNEVSRNLNLGRKLVDEFNLQLVRI